jgi:uncharacterized protein
VPYDACVVAMSADPLAILDQPAIHQILFYPYRFEDAGQDDPRNFFIEVEPGIKIGCRFYHAGHQFPSILFFHGNGEVAADYDSVAPLFLERHLNLLVTDFRGYGYSDGHPTIASLLSDAPRLFTEAKAWLHAKCFTAPLFVMGRSLGSLCAIEVAVKHQQELAGLIVESGSAVNFRNFLALHGLISPHHPVWEEGKDFFNKEKIRKVLLPTLIIHAEHDSIIPRAEAEELYRNAAATSKKLVIIHNADHNDLMEVGCDLYFQSLTNFVASTGG